ncbi:MAG: SDR family oxidoreductase [Armatimonadetes bacterium]|nr:SDR family oxidoreductase [Armatimonadota bacterium]
MASELTGKTALITGGARRIGRETALTLARAGANIVIHYRSSATEAQELIEEVRKLGVRAWSVQADLSSGKEVDRLIDRAWDTAGPLDILVNNASMFPQSSFFTVTLDELLDNIKIDAWAPFALGRQFAKGTETGHIVNFLDTRTVTDYDWTHVGYLASKHMLGLLTKMMAIQLAPGIAVNAVAPGLILPPEGKGESYLESFKDKLPLKRIGKPEYVAEAVLFLVTSEFITGQVIFVDGGRHVREASSG